MEKLQAVAKVTKLFGPDRNGGVVLVLYDTFPEEFDPVETARPEPVEQIGVEVGNDSPVPDGREG